MVNEGEAEGLQYNDEGAMKEAGQPVTIQSRSGCRMGRLGIGFLRVHCRGRALLLRARVLLQDRRIIGVEDQFRGRGRCGEYHLKR